MEMTKLIKKFTAEEDGAVTVDWVVLTAAIVGLGIAVMTSFGPGVVSLSGKISTNLAGHSLTTY
jgi:Flp pilus assembly pilin Flp